MELVLENGLEKLFGKIRVKVKGLSPLLMCKLVPEELEKTNVRRKGSNQVDYEKEAERRAYKTRVNGKEVLAIPNYCIYAMLVNAAKAYKAPKSRASLSSHIAGAIRIEPEYIPLTWNGEHITKYELDIRPVAVNNSRILRARPRIDQWEAEFYILYYKPLFEGDEGILKDLLIDGGIRVGILDYRPQHKGCLELSQSSSGKCSSNFH